MCACGLTSRRLSPQEHADPSVKGTGLVGTFMRVYDGTDGGECPEHFTMFGAHYAELERDLSKTELCAVRDQAPQYTCEVINPPTTSAYGLQAGLQESGG